MSSGVASPIVLVCKSNRQVARLNRCKVSATDTDDGRRRHCGLLSAAHTFPRCGQDWDPTWEPTPATEASAGADRRISFMTDSRPSERLCGLCTRCRQQVAGSMTAQRVQETAVCTGGFAITRRSQAVEPFVRLPHTEGRHVCFRVVGENTKKRAKKKSS